MRGGGGGRGGERENQESCTESEQERESERERERDSRRLLLRCGHTPAPPTARLSSNALSALTNATLTS
jgi:hypothetical protein